MTQSNESQLNEYRHATLDAVTARLAAHCRARESGVRETGLSMRDLLHGLMKPSAEAIGMPVDSSDEAVDAICARYNMVTDLVAGKYGLSLMVDAIIELDAGIHFNQRTLFDDRDFVLTSLAVGLTAIVNARLYDRGGSDALQLDYWRLLAGLMGVNAPWADDTFVGLLAGSYGVNVQARAALAIEGGFDNQGVDQSFVRKCMAEGRVQLLLTVAELGMPAPMGLMDFSKKHPLATTDGGRWLEVLSNHCRGSSATGGQTTTFPRQVAAFAKSAAARDLADILVKLDPNHKGIAALEGTPGHALIMESLMRTRIQQQPSGVAAVNDSGLDAPAARRRARHV